MKKFFSAMLSAALSFSAITQCGTFSVYAENTDAVPVDIEITEEVVLGDISDLQFQMPRQPIIASNFSEGTHKYVDYLNENNLRVYNAMKPLIDEPSVDPITVKLETPVTVTLSTLPTSPNFSAEDQEKYQLALFGSCKPGIDSIMFDYPELCWLDASLLTAAPGYDTRVTRSRTKGTYTISFSSITINPAYYPAFSSIDEVNTYMDKLWDAVEAFPVTGETRYDQLKSIHDHIALFTTYDLKGRFSGSALGSLVEPGVVCEGYSKGFKLICDRLNIPCCVIFGNYNEEENAAHMWNYVQMEDGIWYCMDVTWDDLDGEYGREIKYDYFLKGTKSFNKVHEPMSDYSITILNYPEVSAKDYVYQAVETATTTTLITMTALTTTTTTASTTTTKKPTTTSTTSATTTKKPTTTSTTSTTTTKKPTTTSTTSTTSTKKPTTTSTTSNTTTKKPTATTTTSNTTATKPTTTTTTSTTTTTTQPPKPLKGDLNKDGKVNVADLVYCANAVLGRSKPEYSCDANNDGYTDVFDVIFMRQLLTTK